MIKFKNIILILLILNGTNTIGQLKINSKLRIIINHELILNVHDSCYLLIFQNDQLKEKIDLVKLKSEDLNNTDNVFIDKIIPAGNYIAIIEGLIVKSILITNLNIKQKVITWLPLRYSDLIFSDSPSANFIVKDAKKLFENYNLEYQNWKK